MPWGTPRGHIPYYMRRARLVNDWFLNSRTLASLALASMVVPSGWWACRGRGLHATEVEWRQIPVTVRCRWPPGRGCPRIGLVLVRPEIVELACLVIVAVIFRKVPWPNDLLEELDEVVDVLGPDLMRS